MHKKIFMILFVMTSFSLVADEITIWSPRLEASFPSLTFQDKTLVSGEVSAEKPIKRVSVEMISKRPEIKQSFPCSLYFREKTDKKQAVFKAIVEIRPPQSLLQVVIHYEGGGTFQKTFFLKIAYRIHQYESFRELLKTEPHTQAVNSLQFSMDNLYLLSASDDNKVLLLDPATLKPLKTFRHLSPVTRAVITNDNAYVISCSKDNFVHIWDVEKEKEIKTLAGHAYPPYALALSPDNKTFATGGREIITWSLEEKKKIRQWANNGRKILYLLYTPDGRYLFSSDEEGMARIWNPKDGYLKYERGTPYGNETFAMTLSPDMRTLYTGNTKGAIRCWQLLLDPNIEAWDNEGRKMWERRMFYIKSSYHDPAKLSGSDFAKITDKVKYAPVWTLNNRDDLDVYHPYTNFTQGGSIMAMQFNGTGEFLMLVTRDGELRIHETYTADAKCEVILNQTLQTATFSDNGAFVAVGGAKGQIWLYGYKP